MNRTRSLWETRVVTDLAHGLNVLVVAHGNSLRGLVKLIDKVSDQDIEQVLGDRSIL
jgi:2,3-bisphosphoglycerate-dependent phosphoglycerate mutase